MKPQETDPNGRSYWHAQIEGELNSLRAELRTDVSGLKKQLAEVTRMKWWPVKVFLASLGVVALGLAGFAWTFVRRTDEVRLEMKSEQMASELRSHEEIKVVNVALQNHVTDEMNSRDRLEKKLDKISDVIVFQRPPAVVRNEP